jgi:ketosteroid isomerase-like protein
MSSANVELIRGATAAINRGDHDARLAFFDPDIVCRNGRIVEVREFRTMREALEAAGHSAARP